MRKQAETHRRSRQWSRAVFSNAPTMAAWAPALCRVIWSTPIGRIDRTSMSELSVSVGLAREFRAQVRSTSGEAGSHRTEEMSESESD